MVDFKWTDELVKQYAEVYRFSSSRTSIEQFKEDHQPIIFTTEDGVKITDEKQTLYAVLTKAQWETREDTVKRMKERSSFSTPLNPAWKYFSSDEARQGYILMNKPVHSVSDVMKLCDPIKFHNRNDRSDEDYSAIYVSLLEKKLIELAKTKLTNL